jgi:hypothetical protein
MEGLISLVGFGLGASLGAGLVRSVSGGGRSTLRQAFKIGIQAWNTVVGATGAGSGSAKESELVMPDRVAPTTRTRSRRRSETQPIAIARE